MDGVRLPPISGRDLSLLPTEPRPRGGPLQPLGGAGPPRAVQDHEPQQGYGFDPGCPPGGFQGNVCEVNARANKLAKMLERPRIPRLEEERELEEWRRWAQQEETRRQQEVYRAMHRDMVAGRPTLPWEQFEAMVVPERRLQAAARASPKRRPNTDKGLPRAAKPGRRAPAPRRAISSGDPKGGGRRPDPGSPKYGGPPPPAPIYPGSAWGSGHPRDEAPTAPVPLPTKAFFISGGGQPPPPPPPAPPVADLDEGRPRQRPTETAGGGSLGETHPPKRRAAKVRGRSTEAPEQDFMPQEPLLLQSLTSTKATQPLSPPDSPPPLHVPGGRTAGFPWDAPHSSARQPQPWAEDGLDPSLFPTFGPGHFPMPLPSDGTPPFRSDDQQKDAFRDPDFVPPGHLSSMDPPDGELLQVPVSSPRRRSSTRDSLFPLASSVNTVVFPVDMAPDAVTSPHPLPPAVPPRPAALPPPPAASTPTDVAPPALVRPAGPTTAGPAASAAAATASSAATSTGRLPPPRPRKQNSFTKRVPGSPSPMPVQTEKVTSLTSPLLHYEVDVYEDTDVSDLRPQFNLTGSLGPGPLGPPSLRVRTPLSDLPMALRRRAVELHELERERRQELLNAERMEVEIIRRSYRAQVVPRSFNLGLDHDSEAGSPQTLQQRSQPVPASTAVAMDLPPASPLARPAPPPARPQLSEAERERRLLNVQVRLLELQLGERAERDSLLLEERKQWKGTAEHWATELPDVRLAAVRRLEEQESLQREALQRDCGIALHQLGLEQADARGQARQRELDRLLEQELDMMQLQEAVVALGEQEEGGRQRLAQEADGGWAALVDHFQRGWTAVQMADRLRAEQRQRLRRAELAQAEDWTDLVEEEAVQWAALMRAATAARAKLVDNLLRDLRRLEGEGRQAISDTAMAELMALELLGEDAHQGSLAAGQQRALAELEAAERKARWVLEGQCRDGLRGRAVHWATLRLEAGEGAARKQLRAGEDHEWGLLAAHAERARLAASERHLARVTAKAAANRRRVELQEEEGRQRSDAVRQHAQWWTAMEDAFEGARQRCQERVAAEKLVVAHSLGTVLELEEEDRQQLRAEEAGARRALRHEDDRLWVMTAAYALADELAEMEEEEWQDLQHLLRDALASPIASSASDAGFAPDRPIGHGPTPRAVPSLPASSPAFSHAESPQVSPTASVPSPSASRHFDSASACLSPALATARSAPPLPTDPSLNPGSPTAFSAATAPLSPSVRSSGPPRPSPTTAPSPLRSPATSAAPAEAEYEGRGPAPGFTEELDAAVQGPARQEAPDSSVVLGAEEAAEAERPTSADMVRDFKERYRQKFYRAAAEAAEQLVADQQRLDTAAARERQARVLAMADHDRQQAATMLEANARRRAMLQQEAEEAQAAQAELLARQRSIHEESEARLRELATLEAEQRLLSRVDHLEAPAPVAPALGVVLHAERREEDALEDATSLPVPLQRAGMEARDDRPIPVFIPEAACHHQEPEPPVPPQPTRNPIAPQLQVDSTWQDDNDAVQEALAVLFALEGEQRVPVAAAQERSWAQLLTLEAALQNAAMLAAAERVVRARLLEAHRYFCAKHAAGLAETQRRAAVALAEADLRRGLASEEAAAWRAMAEQEEAVRRSAVSWEETKGFLIIGLVGIQTIEIVSRRELQQDYGLSLGVLSRLMQEEVADLWTTQTLRRIQRQLGIVEVVEAQTRIQLATQHSEFWHSCTSAFAQAMHMSVYRRQFSEAQHGIYARVIQRTFGRFRSRRDARGHLARLRLGTIGEEEDEARWDLESEERLGRAEIAGALDGLLERQHRRAMGLPDRPRPCPAAAAADSDDDPPGNEDADDEDPAALLARQRRQRQKNAPAAPPKERRGRSSKTPRQPLGPLPPTPEAAPRTASPAPDRIRPNLRPLTKQKAAAPGKATVAGVVAVSDTRDLGTVTDYEEFRAVVWEAMRWEEVTAASGIVYYFNAQTQDTHFDPPPGWVVWQRYRIRGDWVVQLSEEAGRCALQLAESTSRSNWPSPPQL